MVFGGVESAKQFDSIDCQIGGVGAEVDIGGGQQYRQRGFPDSRVVSDPNMQLTNAFVAHFDP